MDHLTYLKRSGRAGTVPAQPLFRFRNLSSSNAFASPGSSILKQILLLFISLFLRPFYLMDKLVHKLLQHLQGSKIG